MRNGGGRMAVGVMAMMAGAACHADRVQGPPEPGVPVDLTPQQAAVVEASTAFGLALLRDLHPEEASPNLLISPLSASMSLGMAMNGAAGETFAAMRGTLGFDGLEQDEINEAYRGLLQALAAADPRVEFNLANSIWYKEGFDVNPDFFRRARDYFDAKVAGLDFSDPASPGVINDWVVVVGSGYA
jgi:serine protease inhibitor